MTVFLFPDDPRFGAFLAFDGTENEDHDFSGSLTMNPVESGSTFSDHFILDPQEFSCDVHMTNTPSGPTFEGEGVVLPLALSYPPLPPQAGFGNVVSPNSGFRPPAVSTLQFPGMPDRIKAKLEKLIEIQRAVASMTVLTDRRQYESMVLERISHPNKLRGEGVFKLSFKLLQIANSETVEAPKPKEPRGVPGQNKGEQNPTDPVANILQQVKEQVGNLTKESVFLKGLEAVGLVAP